MKDKIIKYLITILFVLLPIIEMLRVTPIKDIEILSISIIEFINLTLIGISFLLTIPKIKKKHLKYLGVYFFILIIYSIFHIINTYNFKISIIPGATHNFITEAYYIIRVYILPLLLIIILFENKKIFNRNYYLNIIKYLIIIISGQIVLLNLCGFSYSSYAFGEESFTINKTNFFDVFGYTKDYRNLLTVGLLPSANRTSIILFMLLPLNIYNLYLEPAKKNILLTILQVFSMIIIGTRVAALGSIIVLIVSLLMYYFLVIIKKEKLSKEYQKSHIIVLVISLIIFAISPFSSMYKAQINGTGFENDISLEEIESVKDKTENNLTNKEFAELLKENPSVFKIDPIFYEMYPIESDPEFWLTITKRDRKLNNDYRNLKNEITKRVFERNNNKIDKLLGIGYTVGIMDMEKDYVYQYYLFGIIGLVLLIGIYIFFYIYNILKIFKKSYFNYNFCICLVPPLLGLAACYLSGHLFGWVSPMIILATTLCIGRVNE